MSTEKESVWVWSFERGTFGIFALVGTLRDCTCSVTLGDFGEGLDGVPFGSHFVHVGSKLCGEGIQLGWLGGIHWHDPQARWVIAF